MTNTKKTEPRSPAIPKNGGALYEFATLEDGTVVIKTVIVPAAQAKDVKVSQTRVAG